MRLPIVLSASLLFASTTQAQDLQQLMQQAMQKQGGGQVSVEENNDPYEPLGFTGSCRMEVHSFKNGQEQKDSPMHMDLAFTDDRMAMHPHIPKEDGDMRTVFDLKNKVMYTLMTDDRGERTGLKTKMMKVNVDDPSKEEDRSKVVRTDETKVIDGHTCRKYTFKDEDGQGEAWVAEDLDFDLYRAFGRMSSGNKTQAWQDMPYQGLALETTWQDNAGSEKVVMYVRDLQTGSVDEAMFSTKGYEVQDMTAMPTFGR